MKMNKKILGLTSVMILLPVLVGCFFWNRLPETMATHFKLSGQANGFSSRWVTVFGLPSFLLVIHWLCIFVTSKDPKSSNVNPKARHLVYWIIPLASWFALGSIYAHALIINAFLGLFL